MSRETGRKGREERGGDGIQAAGRERERKCLQVLQNLSESLHATARGQESGLLRAEEELAIEIRLKSTRLKNRIQDEESSRLWKWRSRKTGDKKKIVLKGNGGSEKN
jgi:hypothetical protein